MLDLSWVYAELACDAIAGVPGEPAYRYLTDFHFGAVVVACDQRIDHHFGDRRIRAARRFLAGETLHAALIAAAQAVEHYETTRYGTLISWAKELGRNDCVPLLQQTLDEEKATDKKLTAMAESQVNRKAA